MASSRWKRFPFFERHTLSLASEVLENIIPIGRTEGKGSRRSVSALDQAASEALDDSVSLVVTTAALPYNSKPEQGSADVEGENAALVGMWSSLNVCCSALEPAGLDNTTILLPSQAQNFEDDSNVKTSTTAVDGLVLVFASSQETDYVHCFDVTVRCNPPDSPQKDLEDMDGWRGYFAPLKSRKRRPPQLPGPSTLEDRIISDHMTQEQVEGIVGIATCRATTGHRALHMACISSTNLVVVVDPHLYLSCRRPLATPDKLEAQVYELATEWNEAKDGNATSVDIVSGIVAIGTDKGSVHIFTYGGGKQYLRPYLTIPPPPSGGLAVASCRLSLASDVASVFVAYRRSSTVTSPRGSAAGVCCYDMPVPTAAAVPISAPSARHDLDGRQVPSPTLCDAVSSSDGALFTVARPDGLYTYSTTQKVDVAPIDGSKLAVCVIPPREAPGTAREPAVKKAGSSFALVASTDAKSRRDAVDIYDATNKLVAFHFLLSPGHTAIRADGVTTLPTRAADGSLRSGKSSAVIFTSGGSLVTLTEKPTAEKVNLLVQKNLFSAAIFVAYADPSYEVAEITSLYRKHAEYLYRKGDYAAAIDQYINTIGSLEPSHVIFRYLDAPKIPLLVKYLEELRARDLTTAVHNELLRTCYLKLNDSESAEAIAAFTSSAMDTESLSSVVTSSPKNALAMICSFEAPQAAEALVVHGASLARLLPRETAGLAVTLCLGTFSPSRFSESGSVLADAKKVLERAIDDSERVCDPYPVHLFASSFMENTKMLRLILSHCNRNKCTLTPSLRRTLLELTLAEWNQAKRSGDTEVEKLRRKEAIAALTDSHSRDIGDYDALVIVQLAGFEEGELLLYERLQMGPMLLSRYAKDGSEKARRQMLAMCQSDPEILADVLGHFVAMVSENMNSGQDAGESDDDQSDDEDREILLDIQEALSLARRQGILPPVRIARILAGEGTSQFSSGEVAQDMPQHRTIPLSVALDYVGEVLDDSRKEILRLKSEVEEYNQLCNSMEIEIENLLKTTRTSPPTKAEEVSPRINIEDMYTKVRSAADEGEKADSTLDLTREAFWREMEQTEDSFQTISRFFAKGVIQMFEKSLTDIVKGIRASKRDTALYISQCIAEIKTEINSSDMYVKANALEKLTFLHMMGYGMSWASFATIEVMSSPRFAHKRIGYLAASQGFTQDTDVILLTTNLLKKELKGAIGASMNGVYEAGLAINCISNIVTEELAQDLLPEITNLTQHPQPYLRKKAILCLFKVFVKYPQGLRLTFAQLQQCLSDPTPAVVSCAVNVITELADKNPRNYLHLAPAFFDLLTTTSNNWMLIKVVKLLGSLVPEEPRLARKLLEPLADIVRNTPAKSLLYEAVYAITLCLPYCRKSDGTMPASVPDIVSLCAQTLKEFVEEKDPNLKYLGLVGFSSLMVSHPKILSAPAYRPLILTCLSDADVTIRTRALGLLPSMASRKNIVELVTQLLQHVELANGDYKLELVRVIVEMCSGEKYALLPDFAWYLDTLLKLGHIRGLDLHAELLRSQVTDVAIRVLPVRSYAVKRSMEVLLEGEQINAVAGLHSDNGRGKHVMPEILPALAWIVGEYSDLIPEVLLMDKEAVYIYDTNSEGPYHSMVQVLSAPVNQTKLPSSTQKVYVQACIKVFAAATANASVSDIELEACTRTLSVHLPVYMQSTDTAVLERTLVAKTLLESFDIIMKENLDLTSTKAGDTSNAGVAGSDGNLLEMSGLASLNVPSKTNTKVTSSSGMAARCRSSAATLNYLLKPSPMKPSGTKAQQKKHMSPKGMAVDISTPVDLSVFTTIIEEEKSLRAGTRMVKEAVSFTQQRPLHVADRSNKQGSAMLLDAVSSDSAPRPNSALIGNIGEMNGQGMSFQASGGQDKSAPPRSNIGLDRPTNANDPFYLNSGPALSMDIGNNNAVGNQFGAIQLGGDDDSDEAPETRRKKPKKKKKQKAQTMDVMDVFGGHGVAPTVGQSAAVYGSDDEEDINVSQPGTRANTKKGLSANEFQGLANVDLTTPLREDEVMPERKHRVVPERQPQPDVSNVQEQPSHSKSKDKKKKKKKESRRSKEVEADVGDLLSLVSSTPVVPAPAPNAFMDFMPAPAPSSMPQPIMQTPAKTMDAFGDLLDFGAPAPVPQLVGAPPAIASTAFNQTPDIFGGMPSSVAPSPTPVPTSSGKMSWVRGTIKVSHASGSPSVNWSEVQLVSLLEFSGGSTPSASLTVKVTNTMDPSSLNGLTLQLKDVGNVSFGGVQSGGFVQTSKIGPIPYPGVDLARELKGALVTSSGSNVPVKLYLPVTAHFSPVHGLSLEDVARQFTMQPWSMGSTKITISSAGTSSTEAKSKLCSFLSAAEVEPQLSGQENGTFACQSKGGVQVRVLIKVKKDKVKVDVKTTVPQLGEAILADLKRLVL